MCAEQGKSMAAVLRARRYDDSMVRFEAAAVKTQQSLSLLNLGQGVIFAVGTTAALTITGQQVGIQSSVVPHAHEQRPNVPCVCDQWIWV